jgi:putative molybdopterin biosynthesis protein
MSKQSHALISYPDAMTAVFRSKDPRRSVTLPLTDSVGRILAEPLFAQFSVPGVPLGAVDGFAVQSCQTADASEKHPVYLTEWKRCNTGNPVPQEFDAVIRVESSVIDPAGKLVVTAPIAQNKNIRLPGEDAVFGELILPAGAGIRPMDIAALGTYGISEVTVRSVKICIIPSGSELIPLGVKPIGGEIIDSNTPMAESYLKFCGADVFRTDIVPDEYQEIEKAVKSAVKDADIVIISAGTSAGTEDYTEKVIKDLGTLVFHGVALNPGRPALFGLIDEKPVFGMPGYPAAAQTFLRAFIAPLLTKWGIKPFASEEILSVRLGDPFESSPSMENYSRFSVGKIGDDYVAISQPSWSSVQKTTVQSNALIVNPFGSGTFHAGDVVPAIIRCSRDELDSTILIAGAYERIFEPLSNLAKKQGITLRYGDHKPYSALSHLENASTHLSCFVGTDALPTGDFISIQLAVSPTGEPIYLVHRTDLPDLDLVNTLFSLTTEDEFVNGAAALGYHVS